MDTPAIDRLYTRLSSGDKVRGVRPFVEVPVNVWGRFDKDGACTGGTFSTRAEARRARAWSLVQRARVVKAQTVRWYGQPLRVKDGPVVTRVSGLSQRPGSTVYTVGRRFHALITEVTPAVGASLKHTLFKGVLWPHTR